MLRSARRPTRAWPTLAIALVVCLGAPGSPPGLGFAGRDGDTTVERSHAAVLGVAAPAPRASADRVIALPVAPRALPPAPAPTDFASTVMVAPPVGGCPLTSASARAPPPPPHVA